MNREEKRCLAMTIQDVAEEATARILTAIQEVKDAADKASWASKDWVPPRITNNIILSTVRHYIPHRALSEVGVKVYVDCEETASKWDDIITAVVLKLELRGGHPFASKDLLSHHLDTTVKETLFQVKRKRQDGELVFKCLEFPFGKRSAKETTIFARCTSDINLCVYRQKQLMDASQTVLEAMERHGEEEVAELIEAILQIDKKLPATKNNSPYQPISRTDKEVLQLLGRVNPRTLRILSEARDGKRKMPAGVKLSDLPDHADVNVSYDREDNLITSIAQREEGCWVVDGFIGQRTYFRYRKQDAVARYQKEYERLLRKDPGPAAVIVERDYKGEYERYALSPEEFQREFGPRLEEDMPPADAEAQTYTLRPMVHVWYRLTSVNSKEWAAFFTNMTSGLPESDIAAGNIAYIREDYMTAELAAHLPYLFKK